MGYDRRAMLTETDAQLDAIRAVGPVVWSVPLKRWLLVSHDAVDHALRHPLLSVFDVETPLAAIQQKARVDLNATRRLCQWIPFLQDGENHRTLRSLFARLLVDIKDAYLEAYAGVSERLLDALIAKGGGDFAQDYADRVHVETLGALAGWDSDTQAWLASQASLQGIIDVVPSVSEMADASARVDAMFARVATFAAHPPTTRLFERIGHHLHAVGIVDNPAHRVECLVALMVLGRDTLSGTLSIGLGYLLDHHQGRIRPSQWCPNAQVEEWIRLSSAVQVSLRMAMGDLCLGDQHIQKGEGLMLFLPGANHDPTRYDCPHRVGGDRAAHVAFGAGRHLCTGMGLARSALAISAAQLSAVTMEAGAMGEIDRGRTVRQWKHFPVRLAHG